MTSRRIKYIVLATKSVLGFTVAMNEDDASKVAHEVCLKNRVAYISHAIENGKLVVIGERR